MPGSTQTMRLTPWVDEPTWGVLRAQVCAWLWARHQGMRVVLGLGVGAIFRQQARWLGLDWDDEAILSADMRSKAHYLCRNVIAEGKAFKTAFYIGEVAWYGAELADLSPVTWRDALGGEMAVEPGEGWRLYSALLPDLGGGGPGGELASLLADRASGVTHVCLADEERRTAARYGAIARALGWRMPRYAHLPRIDGDRIVRLRRLMAEGESGESVAIRAAETLGLSPADSLADLVPEFNLAQLASDTSGFDPAWQMGFNQDS